MIISRYPARYHLPVSSWNRIELPVEKPVNESIILHEVDERQDKSSDSVLQALLENQKSMALRVEQMRVE